MNQKFKEIYRYTRALYRHRYLATVVALMVMTGIGAYSFFLPKLYQADSTVFIEKNVIDNLVKGIAVTPNINDKIRVLQYALSSRDLIVKALEDAGSDIFTKSKAEQQNYISNLRQETKISVRGSDLFTVSLIGKDPGFIQKYVNTLVGKYVEENTSSQREEAYGANRFLSEQIDAFKEKLEKAEDAIIAFRKKQGIYFSVDEKSTLEEIKSYLGKIEGIESSIETLNAKSKQLQQQLETLNPTVESIISADNGLQGIEGDPQLLGMEKRLSDLRLRYTENYPEIIRLKFEIESLRKRLTEQPETGRDIEESKMTSLNPLYLDVQQRLLEIQSELTSQQAEKQNLQKLVEKRETALHEVPVTRKQLKVLIEERDSMQKIYQDLLARMGQSEVSKQMEINNKSATFRVVDPAIYPEIPVSPNMLKMFLLAVAAGLGCAGGVIFLLENLDTRIRDIDFFNSIGIDVLAIIPNIVDKNESARIRKRDMIFFGVSSAYWLCFSGLFAIVIFLR